MSIVTTLGLSLNLGDSANLDNLFDDLEKVPIYAAFELV
jgi:hypothetical protein